MSPKKNTNKKRKSGAGRPTRHPWDEIEAVYVQGEDVDRPGKDGQVETTREWPSMTSLADRYKLRLDSLSRRFAQKDSAGKTVHQRREDFKADFSRQVEAKLVAELAGREVGFRRATMAIAEGLLAQCAKNMGRPLGPDGLAKLSGAVKRAQEIGMVALDRPANGPNGGEGGKGGEDWTLMREIRSGARKPTTEGQ